ncbi:MAG: 1,6-anhydro-N-acetylmuramyl-L-alanine amidase AmpD [Gammaproteobacteria bacterium]
MIDLETGLLTTVVYKSSAHCDDRPERTIIDMIVIHCISLPPGQFGTGDVEDFFCGKLDIASHSAYPAIAHLKVSAHLFIKRTGEIIQFVPFNRRAWHAGESFFAGKTRCNDFSIGIELEGTDDIPYERKQYEQLAGVIAALKQAYPAITHDRIVGHVDIAPGRKTDPGPAFDWDYLKGLIA